ncbi:MAG TPA: VOC family protein [Candidatus Udaeobacter sp.]
MKKPNESKPIDPRVRIGHVHLKLADLERALTFYCGVLGFELMERHGDDLRLFPPAVIIIISV